MRHFILLPLALSLSGPAAAQVFKVGDLGHTASRSACMERATKVFEVYINEFGGHSTTSTIDEAEGWAVYAWGLRPGDNDMVITCPIVANQPNAFYTLHSDHQTGAEEIGTIAERIHMLWEAPR